MRASILLLLLVAASARAGDPRIAQAIEQIMRDDAGRRAAERTLQASPDRAAVVEEAARALLNGVHGIGEKRRLLWFLLYRLEEGDVVAQTLESSSLSAKRAAAVVLAGRPEHAEAVKSTLLGWIAAEPPPDLALLVEACRERRLAEAAPWLRKILDAPDTTPRVFADALTALAANPPPDLAEIVRKRVADPKEDPARFGACVDAIRNVQGLQVDDLMLPWLKQREDAVMRNRAAMCIRDPAPLREVLFDPDEPDAVVQRNCLNNFMHSLDDAALLELLRDRRVNRHRYFAIRVDVSTALAAVEGSGTADIPLLLDYMVDEDPQDKNHIVRSEAWLTLWTLTGQMHGAKGDFETPPPRGGREFRATRMRPGVTAAQRTEIEGLAKDLDHMRKVRDAYAAAR